MDHVTSHAEKETVGWKFPMITPWFTPLELQFGTDDCLSICCRSSTLRNE
jgi:hypothetical protein